MTISLVVIFPPFFITLVFRLFISNQNVSITLKSRTSFSTYGNDKTQLEATGVFRNVVALIICRHVAQRLKHDCVIRLCKVQLVGGYESRTCCSTGTAGKIHHVSDLFACLPLNPLT